MKRLKLVAFDLDGTLTKGGASIWYRLHVRFGTLDGAAANMKRFFAHEICYAEWAQLDAALWKGQPASAIDHEVARSEVHDGAVELAQVLAARGVKIAIISGGLDTMALSIARRFGCPGVISPDDVLSNTLGVDAATGLLNGTAIVRVGWQDKGELVAALAQRHGVALRDVCFVGDGENDLPAFAVVGHSIALNASLEKVEKAAQHSVHCSDLRALLPLLLPPARLVLVRHGHGEHNAARERVGPSVYLSEEYRDAQLTAKGRQQAAVDLRRALESDNIHAAPDMVFASPLQRCITTALIAFPGTTVVLDDRLIERLGQHPCNHRAAASAIVTTHGAAAVDVTRLTETAPWPLCFEPEACVQERMKRFVDETLSAMGPGEVAVAISSYEAILHFTGKALNNCEFVVCEKPMFNAWQPWVDLGGDEEEAALAKVEAAQPELLRMARVIVEGFPPTGVYPGENDAAWNAFLPQLLHVFDIEEGERGDAKRLAREGMRNCAAELAPAFAALGGGCNVETSIEELARRVEHLPHGRVWTELEKLRKRIATLECAVANLAFTDSAITKQIVDGLTAKLGRAKALEQLGDITAQRFSTLSQFRESERQLVAQLESDEQYQLRVRVESLLNPYLKLWETADRKMGRDSNVRGATLEVKSRDLAVRLVMRRLGIRRVCVLSNLSWANDVPGEADVVLIDATGTVVAMIEQKANLFDVACAYAQSGPGHRR